MKEDPICADFDELSNRKSQLHSISITIWQDLLQKYSKCKYNTWIKEHFKLLSKRLILGCGSEFWWENKMRMQWQLRTDQAAPGPHIISFHHLILNINSSFHHALIKLYTGDSLIFEGCHSNLTFNVFFLYSQYVHYIKCHILYQFSNNLEWNQNWSLVLSAMESFNHNFRILNKIFNILLFNKKCKFQIWLLKNWFIVALHARVEKMISA